MHVLVLSFCCTIVCRIFGLLSEPLLVCDDNLVAHPSLLRTLATEPAGRSTALVVADGTGDLVEDRGRVVPASGGGRPVRYLGALCLAPADLPLLAKMADRPGNLGSMFASTFALTLANPSTIISFAAIFAGLGLTARTEASSALLMVAGVFLGSATWWLILSFRH